MRPPILHVAPFLWSGAGGVITRLCEHQRRSGPVVLVTTGRSEGLEDWPSYRQRLRSAGVRHVTLDAFHRDAPRFWTSAARLARLLADLRPAVVHAHAGVPCALAAAARALSGARARLVGQMYSWAPGRPGWMNHQDALAFSAADVAVCSARAYQALLVRHGVPPRRLAYVPWGLPLETLPWRETPPDGRGGAIVGCVGRLEPRKAQLALVEAFARLPRSVAARLELVGPAGDREYAARVRTSVRALGLGRSVRLLGRIDDVPARLRGWDLFVSLSQDEGQGLAVLEAMAVGVPVAARAVPGIEDFLADGRTGWAIRGRSPAAAAAVIRRALTDETRSRAIARQARLMVERRYDWTRMLAAFDRIYRGS